MKKIIFVDVPMRELYENSKQCYANTGNTICTCNEKVFFPINAVLYDKLKKYGLETIQTGQMKSRRNGKGGRVDLAEDLIVIPKDRSIGEKTLAEFLQNVNASTTIYLSDNEYQDLIT